jgi:hypothetical protein
MEITFKKICWATAGAQTSPQRWSNSISARIAVRNYAGSNRCQNYQELRPERGWISPNYSVIRSGLCILKTATGVLRTLKAEIASNKEQ